MTARGAWGLHAPKRCHPHWADATPGGAGLDMGSEVVCGASEAPRAGPLERPHHPVMGFSLPCAPWIGLAAPEAPPFFRMQGVSPLSPVFTCSSWSPLYQNSSLSKQSLCILQLPLRINSNDMYERGQGPNLPLRISAPPQFCPWSPDPAASSELALGPAGREAQLLDHGGVCRALPRCGGQELSLRLQPSCHTASCSASGLQEQRSQTAQSPT